MSRLGKRIFLIPDTQVRPGVPTEHFDWVGQAIRDYKPDAIVHLGDHWDMESLSKHSGPLGKEGKRYIADIDSGNAALERLNVAMGDFKPKRKIILRGNHERRIVRAIEDDPRLKGALTYDHFNDKALGWDVVDYNGGSPGIVDVFGVKCAHYFTPSNSSNAMGGDASYKLAKIGEPFAQGHVQGLSIGDRQWATGRVIRGVQAGSCYLHDEGYKSAANAHWRGIVVLNEVEPGREMSVMDVTLRKLCLKYEGTSLARFMQRRYRRAKERFSVAA
jgi:Calcineurin-like phosphoesterase